MPSPEWANIHQNINRIQQFYEKKKKSSNGIDLKYLDNVVADILSKGDNYIKTLGQDVESGLDDAWDEFCNYSELLIKDALITALSNYRADELIASPSIVAKLAYPDLPWMYNEEASYKAPSYVSRHPAKLIELKKNKEELCGMSPVKWARTKLIASKKPLSPSMVKQMADQIYFQDNYDLEMRQSKKENKPMWHYPSICNWWSFGGSTGIQWAVNQVKGQS